MFLTDKKLENRISELWEYRYRDIRSLKEFLTAEDEQNITNPVPPSDFVNWDRLAQGDVWSGRDRYLWLHRDVEIPAEWKEKTVVGIFDFGNTGAGNNSGFESLLYLNGKPYQGVDANHKEVFLDPAYCGDTVSLTFRLWSGLEGGGKPRDQEHKINRADLAWLDETVDGFCYMGSMIVEELRVLDKNDPVRFDLQSALDEACILIDWSDPGSEAFYESVHRAAGELEKRLSGMEKHSEVNVSCIGHTHIDVAWLWRLKHTREKASRSFSTVLRLMERYPEYVFLQTQPQLYEYIKEDFPDIYEQIREKVRSGQWETDGAMWVEADCNLTSGESLTRQILLGSRFFKEEFGKDVEYLWLPDVFGYSWALPQILKKAGIHTFMTTKISWNQYNRMPHDTFRWKGIDGSEVLTHFITTVEPWSEPGSWFYTYNGKLTPGTVKGSWEAYSDKELNKDILIAYGYGDGGGGVNRDMLEQRRCLDRLPGLPNVKNTTAGEYFRKLHETFDSAKRHVPVWDGELYLEYHRGTYTSHAYNKLMNRKMEQLYRRAEWMTVMQGLYKHSLAEAKQETLTKGWKHILTNQFHDIIPGSSIKEVYEDSRKDYEWIGGIAREVESEFLQSVSDGAEAVYTVFNSTCWERDGLVELQNVGKGCWRDEAGQLLESQEGREGTWVYVKEVPSMGMRTITHTTDEAAEPEVPNLPFVVENRKPFTIETPFYVIALNDAGQMIRLYDKEYDKEVLADGSRANVLQMFEDKPLGNDAWDIDIFYQEKMREITQLEEFGVTEQGALRMAVHMKYLYGSSVIDQEMILYAHSRRIDFRTHVDFHERHQLLKAAFPVDIRSTYATYDVQYGNVRRPNHWNTSWDQARFESVAHRWADISERNYGVSLLNDCKYGHDIKDNVLRITLLKSANHPDYEQDQGEHEFTYSLLPHGGDFVEGRSVQEAADLNDPMSWAAGRISLGYESFVSLDNSQIELDAVKKSEDGECIVLRFHEFAGSSQKVLVTPGFAYKAWAEADLRERPVESRRTGEVRLELHPYEIKTLLFWV